MHDCGHPAGWLAGASGVGSSRWPQASIPRPWRLTVMPAARRGKLGSSALAIGDSSHRDCAAHEPLQIAVVDAMGCSVGVPIVERSDLYGKSSRSRFLDATRVLRSSVRRAGPAKYRWLCHSEPPVACRSAQSAVH